MLEERLSSAYSQHNLGYNSAVPARDYPPLVNYGPDSRPGVENFYRSPAPPDQFQPMGPPHHPGVSHVPAPAPEATAPYPSLNPNLAEVPGNLQSPPPVRDNAYPAPTAAPANFYTSQAPASPEVNQAASTPQGEVQQPSYDQASPTLRRQSQYAPPQPAPSSAPYTSPPAGGYPYASPPPPDQHVYQPPQESQPPAPQSSQPAPAASSPYYPEPVQPGQGYAAAPPPNGYYHPPPAAAVASPPPPQQAAEPPRPKPVVEESLIDL